MHQIAFFFGLTSANSWTYLAWSGAAGDLAKITVPAALLVALLRQMRIHHRAIKEHHAAILKALKEKETP